MASCDGVFLSGSLPLCEIVIVLVVTDVANKFSLSVANITRSWRVYMYCGTLTSSLKRQLSSNHQQSE